MREAGAALLAAGASGVVFAGLGWFVGQLGGQCHVFCQPEVTLPMGGLAGLFGHAMARQG